MCTLQHGRQIRADPASAKPSRIPLHGGLHPAHQRKARLAHELAPTQVSIGIQCGEPIELGRQLQVIVHSAMRSNLLQLFAHIRDVRLRTVHVQDATFTSTNAPALRTAGELVGRTSAGTGTHRIAPNLPAGPELSREEATILRDKVPR